MTILASSDKMRGRSIHAARILAGIDQKQLAGLLKWSPAKLSGIENGAPIDNKSWVLVRRHLLRKGSGIQMIKRHGAVIVSGFFEEPEIDEDADGDEFD